jgi:hypothetical protein
MKLIKSKQHYVISLILLFFFLVLTSTKIYAPYTKQDFIVNNDTEVILDIDSETYYNGSISFTVTSGVGINATVNSVTKEILLDETKIFGIINTTIIYVEITAVGYVEGFFELDLNIDLPENRGPIRLIIGILAGFLVILSTVSYYIKTNRMKTKTDEEEDEELKDPEVARRRREAAGAEKRYLGLED